MQLQTGNIYNANVEEKEILTGDKNQKINDVAKQISTNGAETTVLIENVNIRKKIDLKNSIKKKALKKPVLSTLDILVIVTVITPVVVTSWRGTWGLMDFYSYYFPHWESFICGIAIHSLLAIGQETFHDILIEHDFKKYKFVVTSQCLMKGYTYVFTVVTNLHWRGGWGVLDAYCGVQFKNKYIVAYDDGSKRVVIIALMCVIILSMMKALRNCTAPPFSVCLDKGDDMFLFPTMFKQKLSEKTYLYVLDCLFSVLIVGTMVVVVWRGLWLMVDLYLFPNNVMWSAWSSLILGYALVAVAFLLQPAMRYVCGMLSGAPRLLMADFFILFSVIGTVHVWRGIWILLDCYFLPDNQELSFWITHSVSLIILILLGCSNSLLVRGVYIDAEEPAGKCVVFPCYYLRIIFQEENQNKLKIELNDQNCENIANFECNSNEKTLSNTDKIAENNHVANKARNGSLKDEYQADAR